MEYFFIILPHDLKLFLCYRLVNLKVNTMGKQGIYIFEDTNSFLKQMQILIKEYNKPKPRIIYLNKHLDSCKSVRKELNFIKKCYINSFDSFYTSQVVRITITDYTNCTINIKYTFKGTGYLFSEFRRYIKRNKENIYL